MLYPNKYVFWVIAGKLLGFLDSY
jgi:hypothetical protein